LGALLKELRNATVVELRILDTSIETIIKQINDLETQLNTLVNVKKKITEKKQQHLQTISSAVDQHLVIAKKNETKQT